MCEFLVGFEICFPCQFVEMDFTRMVVEERPELAFSKKRGIPEDRITKSIVMSVCNLFIEIDRQCAVFMPQFLCHTLLVFFRNNHT
jgi:hypothetical protein